MSSAQPVSPDPRLLTFGTALGLFELPGCPACRHVTDATAAYLRSLALEGCRDPGVLNRLSASRGLCGAHTRGLLAEPAAVPGLVLAYRYVIESAVGDVAARPAVCPACQHASSTADVLLGYLLGEATRGDRRTYKQHGGLCIPHLRRAAVARRGADILWLVRFMIARLTAPSPGLDLLAGVPDVTTPLGPPSSPGKDPAMCAVCAVVAATARSPGDSAAGDCLCPQHLRDTVMADGSGAADLLVAQAALHAARLGQVVDGRARSLGNYLSVRARRALADPDCPVCRRCEAAAAQAIGGVVSALRQSGAASSVPPYLCLRHLRDISDVDPDAGRMTAVHLSHRGQRLLAELTVVTEMNGAGRVTGSVASGATALRRAALYLDGSAFGSAPVSSGYGPGSQVRLRYSERRRGSP